MSPINPIYLEHQIKRGMRSDAHLFVRPDWQRHVRPGFGHEFLLELYEGKYSPDQPRDDHGRWTVGGGAFSGTSTGAGDNGGTQVAGAVIHVCIAGSSSRFSVGAFKVIP